MACIQKTTARASRFFHLNVKTLSHDKTTIPPEPATGAGLSLVPLFLLGFTLGQPFTGLALFGSSAARQAPDTSSASGK
jgi:hypothetical protein